MPSRLVITEESTFAEAVDGAAAMEQVPTSGQFDLAVLDVGLPDTDGRELCKRMRKKPFFKVTRGDADRT